MRFTRKLQRPLTIALLALVAIGSIAPFAEAGHRRPRYRGAYVERRVVVRPVYRTVRVVQPVPYARYTVWHSGSGPVIAGFLGGLFLGATLTNAAPHGYVYWDPYCHRSFASLELYDAHCRGGIHDRDIEVVESPSGCSQSGGGYEDRQGNGDDNND